MHRGWGSAVRLLVAAVAVLAVMAPVAKAAPAGDDFAAAVPLAGALPIVAPASNEGATAEPGESVGPFAAGHSVWFTWTADATRWVTVGTCGSPFPAVVGIFTGNELGSLTRVVEGNSAEGPRCAVGNAYTFRAIEGTGYRIAVDGNGFYLPPSPQPTGQGAFTLRIEATPPPANDDFANPAPIAGRISEEPNGARFYMASVDGYNWGATKQAGEPDHGGDPGGASVWFTWTAPESGPARVSTQGVGAAIIGVYTGSALGSLVPVASNPSSGFAHPQVTAGTTYLIAVDGRRDPETGTTPAFGFQLQISMLLASGPGIKEGSPQPSPVPSAQAMPAPRTILLKRSVDPDRRSATFVFKSSAAGSRFRCKLDKGPYRACHSPKTYRNLAGGRHTVKLVAVDAAGAADPTPVVAHLRIPRR